MLLALSSCNAEYRRTGTTLRTPPVRPRRACTDELITSLMKLAQEVKNQERREHALRRELAERHTSDHPLTPCDTAPYTNRCTAPTSCQFLNFGGKNHKHERRHLVSVEYRQTTVIFTPSDFPTAAIPLSQTPVMRTVTAYSRPDPRDRARRFMASVAPAIAGQHGDLRTFRICCRLVRGFALTDEEALSVLTDWNARCAPPWSKRELLEKLANARRYGREPHGGLLDSADHRSPHA